MDMFHKLKSTVTGFIPGNPVQREFEILHHRSSGGPGLFWKIYDGYKKSTKQEASIFMFEKKQIDRYSNHDKNLIIETLKKGVSQLTRLKHPKILSVLHPLEESRESLAFATEPVFASLANVLGKTANIPDAAKDITDHNLYDVEIKYGLLQVTEGLSFLHNDVKLVHNNICPESIIITKSGSWKLFGFDICIKNANQQDQAAYFPFQEWNPNIPYAIQPSLDYMAPEYVVALNCDTASDMFSLGMLFYTIFNKGKVLLECRNEMSAYKKNLTELKRMKISLLGAIPEEVREHIKMCLNSEPSLRPDSDQLTKIPFFEDVGAMTLQYLDSLFQRDNLEKSQFFKGLPKVIEKMPKRVNVHRILPPLFKECVNCNMVPFVLPNIMIVAEQATEDEFARFILPSLTPIFQFREPIQITFLLMQNMNLLLSKAPQNDIKNHVLPMLYRTLETDSPQIQEMSLNILPSIASLIEYSSMKNALVPRIKKLCLSTTSLGIRVTCLVTLGKLLEYMDKWYVLDEVLPITAEVPSREPAVLMSMLGIYKVAMSHKKLGITKDVMANKVLPFLFPLAIDNNLNLAQFNAFMAIIKEMISKVESEHRSKLEQLNTIHQEQRTLQLAAEQHVGVSLSSSSAGVTMAKPAPASLGATTEDPREETMMGKFMSGFGISSYLTKQLGTGASSAPAAPAPIKPDLNNPINQMSEVPVPKQGENKLPNQPAKVNLTLEEKARLAKEQEQQERFKSQPKLTPAASSAAPSKPAVKDLTSSLMNTNFMSTPMKNGSGTMGNSSSSTTFSTASYGQTGSFSSAPTFGGNTMSNTGQQFSSPGFSTSTMGQSSAFASPGGDFTRPMAQQKPDMSAFDSLLPSKPKPTMNQMSRGGGGLQAQPVRPNMGMMGNPNTMGMGMIGNPPMTMNQGFMGNPGMMGMRPPLQYQQNTPSSKPLSSQDINDLLS